MGFKGLPPRGTPLWACYGIDSIESSDRQNRASRRTHSRKRGCRGKRPFARRRGDSKSRSHGVLRRSRSRQTSVVQSLITEFCRIRLQESSPDARPWGTLPQRGNQRQRNDADTSETWRKTPSPVNGTACAFAESSRVLCLGSRGSDDPHQTDSNPCRTHHRLAIANRSIPRRSRSSSDRKKSAVDGATESPSDAVSAADHGGDRR